MTTTIASTAMTEACWPEEIPQDYQGLHTMYGNFIASALRRHNKVGRNFEELYSYIWSKLIEKDVITLFMSSVQEKLPRQMTAVEACAYLGVNWKQWEVKMWAYHAGDPVKSKHNPDLIVGRRQGGWMPSPINSDLFRKKLVEENEKRVAKGLEPKPEPACPGCQSKHALYDIDDIITLQSMERLCSNGTVQGPFNKQGPMHNPQMKVTRAHFQAYLAKSIYSDWANWCRGWKRHWEKDRPMYVRETDDPDAPTWEAKLESPGGAVQETQAVLKQACRRISDTLKEGMKDVPGTKPVEQIELEVFGHLESGVPLPEAVRKVDLPEKVRRSILKSVADFRVRAA